MILSLAVSVFYLSSDVQYLLLENVSDSTFCFIYWLQLIILRHLGKIIFPVYFPRSLMDWIPLRQDNRIQEWHKMCVCVYNSVGKGSDCTGKRDDASCPLCVFTSHRHEHTCTGTHKRSHWGMDLPWQQPWPPLGCQEISLLFTWITMETASACVRGREWTLGNPMLCVRARDRVCVCVCVFMVICAWCTLLNPSVCDCVCDQSESQNLGARICKCRTSCESTQGVNYECSGCS